MDIKWTKASIGGQTYKSAFFSSPFCSPITFMDWIHRDPIRINGWICNFWINFLCHDENQTPLPFISQFWRENYRRLESFPQKFTGGLQCHSTNLGNFLKVNESMLSTFTGWLETYRPFAPCWGKRKSDRLIRRARKFEKNIVWLPWEILLNENFFQKDIKDTKSNEFICHRSLSRWAKYIRCWLIVKHAQSAVAASKESNECAKVSIDSLGDLTYARLPIKMTRVIQLGRARAISLNSLSKK